MGKINESRVIIENGEVKTIFSEEIQRTGYMSVEEARMLTHQYVAKIKETMSQQNESRS